MNNLRQHQIEGVKFILEHPKCGLFWSMGTGKTLTALTALKELGARSLIVAPLRVAHHVWPAEIEKWGFDLSYQIIHGRKKAEQLEASREADITIVNPEGLKHVHNFCRTNRVVPWQTILVDESTMFKEPTSKRWGLLAGLCRIADRVVILTGTPISGRGFYDIWGQAALWGEANPLPDWSTFCDWFEWDQYGNPRRLIHPEWAEYINQAIAPLVLRKSVSEVDMPKYVEMDHWTEMPEKITDLYDEVSLREHGYAPLRTLCSGFLYETHWSGTQTARWYCQDKLDLLEQLARDTGDNLLVFVNFTAEADVLADRFGAKIVDGRTSDRDATIAINAWNSGSLPMLVMHPRSAGHGLNLQSGGHRVVWFSLPDSGELYQQANARLYRSGQENAFVVVHRLVTESLKLTIEEIILRLLQQKILNESNLLNALAAA